MRAPAAAAPRHPPRAGFWIALGLALALYVILRARWIGHMLVWDEAMNLCTVRAFVSQGEDFSSEWFWRHPPLFCLLMTLLAPLQAGFAERVEWLAVGLGCVNLVLLCLLNRRWFGTSAAIAGGFLLALMPGSNLFDVWIKNDHVATTFGLAALLAWSHGRMAGAGLLLGLALLGKETAVFYCAGVVLLHLLAAPRPYRLADLGALVLTPLLTSGWWFLAFGRVAEHVAFAAGDSAEWLHDWHHPLQQLLITLEPAGILLALGGCATLLAAQCTGKGLRPPAGRLWPLAVLVPAYVLLSLLPAKVSWIVIVLFPAWATLQAVAVAAAWQSRATRPGKLACLAVALAIALLGRNAARHTYDAQLARVDDNQWRGAQLSRAIATAMNAHIRDGDSVLLSTMHFWAGMDARIPDAIVAYEFQRDAAVILVPHTARFAELEALILRHRPQWAVVSPAIGGLADEVFSGFRARWGLAPIPTPGAVLYHTAKIPAPAPP